MKTCSLPGCSKPCTSRLSRGRRYFFAHCSMHRSRWARCGSFDLPKRAPRPARPCSAPGCEKRAKKGSRYCGMHTMRLRRTGSLDRATTRREAGSLCACGKVARKSRPECSTCENRRRFQSGRDGKPLRRKHRRVLEAFNLDSIPTGEGRELFLQIARERRLAA